MPAAPMFDADGDLTDAAFDEFSAQADADPDGARRSEARTFSNGAPMDLAKAEASLRRLDGTR